MNKGKISKTINLLMHQNLYVVNNGTKEKPDFVVGGTELLNKELTKLFSLYGVVSSFITSEDEGKYFIINTDKLDEIEKGSVVYLLNTYPEDIHLFTDKNGDEVWIDADDVDRKK